MSKIIGFWNHTNEQYEFLSNFYEHDFEAPIAPFSKKEMGTFHASEQYFMYLKCLVFKDNDSANKILNLKKGTHPSAYKKIGRSLKGYDQFDQSYKMTVGQKWEEIKDTIMKKAVFYKFKDKNLKKRLIETQNAILVEASPYDYYWGAGVGLSNIHSENWPGKNKLGLILMDIRSKSNN